MSGWREIPARPDRSDRRAHRSRVVRALVPFVVAALAWWLGLHGVAVAVAIAATVLLVATAVRPSVGARIEAVFVAVGSAVGHVLTTVLLGIVELAVFLPLSLLARLFRRDPLASGRGAGAGTWLDRVVVDRRVQVQPIVRRPYGREVVRPRGKVFRATYLAVRVVGWVVIALVANYAIGWTWDEFFGTHDMPVAAAVSEQTADELAASPAMAGDEWARDYWREFRGLEYEFHPFILSRVASVEGRFIQTQGPVRRSYEASDLGAGVPEVWFLGGAALWGEGQRDDHTIPSEVARLADQAGTPIRAVNLGQPGYTSWQSALLLEQQLAVRPAPDLVVFYDGAADVAVQIEQASQDPTHYNVEGVTGALTGRDSARQQAQDWWDEYRETSVVSRLVDRVQGVFGVQPAAADGPGLADRVADLHARSVDLASFVAGQRDVPVVFTWQAAEGVTGDGGAYRRVAAGEDPSGDMVDLSRVLDEQPGPVYLDGVLTNEEGAAVVAASLWPLIVDELS